MRFEDLILHRKGSRPGERMDKERKLQVIRSSRRTISLEVKPDLTVVVRVPLRMRERDIQAFLREKADWIERTIEKLEKQTAEAQKDSLSMQELKQLADLALEKLPERVAYYASQIGVTYGRITIRNQRTRWGSCSSKGNLNFNCLLMLMPAEIQDYVVVHELCHRLEMNHSKAFWGRVEEILPDYKARRKWLKDHGAEIMARII